MQKKEEIGKEVNNLILEVVLRLKRENPQLLQLLFSASESEETSTSKNSENKVSNKKHGK